MRRSIGIDVSQNFLDVASYDGNTIKSRHYEGNKLSVFKQIIKDFKIEQNTLVVMEVTGVYHLQLAHYLLEKGHKVSVVNPLMIKRYGEMKFMRIKSDKADAKTIAYYGFEQSPPLYCPRSAQREELMILLKAIEDLSASRDEYRNRIHSLKKRFHSSLEALEVYQKLYEKLGEEIERLNKQITSLAQQISPESYKRMIEIPGVGPKLSSTIIAYFGEFESFENAKQVVAFAGLNPNPRSSGTSVKKQGNISKKGHPFLRKILFMCALMASHWNPSCQKLYKRLVESGKAKKLALIAVANKLLRQIFAIVKYKRNFEKKFVKDLT